MEKCSMPRCNREWEIDVLGKKLCDRHWDEHCNQQEISSSLAATDVAAGGGLHNEMQKLRGQEAKQ